MPDAAVIGGRLRNLRGEKPREVVSVECGISVSALAMYETGKRIPRDEVKVALAQYYRVSVGDLFFKQKSHVS